MTTGAIFIIGIVVTSLVVVFLVLLVLAARGDEAARRDRANG